VRILQVSDKAPGEGGIAAHVAAVSAELEARHHQVLHLQLEDAPPGAMETAGAAHRLPKTYGLIPGQRLRGTLRELLAAARPQLIHVHECFTTLSPLLLRELQRVAPVVGTLHDVRPFCYIMTRRFRPTGALCSRRCGFGCFSSGCVRPQAPSDFARLPRRWLMDRLSLDQWRRLSRVVVPSGYLCALAQQHGIAASRVRLVPHGTNVMARAPAHRQRPLPALIVYLGSLVDYKGPDVLVAALALLREKQWEAILIGDGPLRASLEQQVRRQGLSARIRFHGHVGSRSRVDALLSQARLLALPSLVPESFAMAGIEALALGTPVVSFGLGGVREWLRDGDNGLIAADSDPADLARQMSALIDDPALAEAMGQRGYELVTKRFTLQQAVDGLLAVYDELLG
jgi:glycosyltransferase involved in cell wall biosynthesis